VSNEPAEILAQLLELPNQDGPLSEDIERVLIEKLAEQLGIDPQYISLTGSFDGGAVYVASRNRALSAGLSMTITILSDDTGTLEADLAALTLDPSFWQNVNDRIVATGATTTLDTSGIVVLDAVPACNVNFRSDNVSGCIFVLCGEAYEYLYCHLTPRTYPVQIPHLSLIYKYEPVKRSLEHAWQS
jgi:hypothetical protein